MLREGRGYYYTAYSIPCPGEWNKNTRKRGCVDTPSTLTLSPEEEALEKEKKRKKWKPIECSLQSTVW